MKSEEDRLANERLLKAVKRLEKINAEIRKLKIDKKELEHKINEGRMFEMDFEDLE